MRVNVQLCFLATAGIAAASPFLEPRAPCGENGDKICYGVKGGTSQNLDVSDVEYAATYLRYLGTTNSGEAAFWTMPASVDCAEWTLPIPTGSSVLALAKHINPRIKSSILYTDLANAIDGGENASPADKENALLGCGKNGGQFGVHADTKNPAYNTPEYQNSKAKPEGIIIKLVRDPAAPAS